MKRTIEARKIHIVLRGSEKSICGKPKREVNHIVLQSVLEEKMKRAIEVRNIGVLSVRLITEAGVEYVELFVRLKSADSKADRLRRVRESERTRRKNNLRRRAAGIRSMRGRK